MTNTTDLSVTMPATNAISIIGCGYIGKRLAQQLTQQDISVHGTVSTDHSLVECKRLDIDCELLDLDESQTTIEVSGRHIIYLAPPPRSGRSDTRMTNFLKAIERSPPARFVLISTTGVYGDCNGEWIDETRPLNPLADRAHRRADAEVQTQRFCKSHDIPLVILRVAGIYGPGKVPVKRIQSGEPIVRREDSPFTNRIHAHDLVDICQKALLDESITGIYNVTDGHPGTMYEYFTGIADKLGLPPPPAISLEQARTRLSEGMLSYMAESRRIDNTRLLRDFAIELQYPTLRDGLAMIE